MEEGFHASNSGHCIESTIAKQDKTEEQKGEKDYSCFLCKSGQGLISHYSKQSHLCPLNKINEQNVCSWEENMVKGTTQQQAVRKSERKESRKFCEINKLQRSKPGN